MRFQIGPPPRDVTMLENGDSWNVVSEPSPLKQQLIGICIAAVIALCIALVVFLSIGPRHVFGVSWPLVILFIFLVLPVHELLHAIGFKGGIASDQVVLGFNPKACGFYAHYGGQMSRNRYVIIAALPLLVLTIIPLAIVVVLQLDYVRLTEIAIANGLASAGDVLSMLIVVGQVPRQSVLINSGMKSYWKPVANKPLQ